MPWCVVPKCIANKRKENEKVSTFKVPTDEDLREKWRVAIRVDILRSSHRVCEMHFQENLVIKNYIHTTKDGNIIAEVKYYFFFRQFKTNLINCITLLYNIALHFTVLLLIGSVTTSSFKTRSCSNNI